MEKSIEVRSLFKVERDRERSKAQQRIFDEIAANYDVPAGQYRDFINSADDVQDGRRSTFAEAWILENAVIRGITVKELLRNVLAARILLSARKELTEKALK